MKSTNRDIEIAEALTSFLEGMKEVDSFYHDTLVRLRFVMRFNKDAGLSMRQSVNLYRILSRFKTYLPATYQKYRDPVFDDCIEVEAIGPFFQERELLPGQMADMLIRKIFHAMYGNGELFPFDRLADMVVFQCKDLALQEKYQATISAALVAADSHLYADSTQIIRNAEDRERHNAYWIEVREILKACL